MSTYQHIRVPEQGQKITVNADTSLNVPTSPSFHSSKVTEPARTSRPS